MFPTSTFQMTFFDEALPAQCSVKKSQSKCVSREYLKILPYNIMTLSEAKFVNIEAYTQWIQKKYQIRACLMQ